MSGLRHQIRPIPWLARVGVAAAASLLGACNASPRSETIMTPSPGQPHYYATWTGYGPPVRPHNPIDYERAESGKAFSVFVFDDAGRVTSFEKWLVHRTRADDAILAGRPLPPGTHFFAYEPDAPARLGAPVTLDDTRTRTDYYRVQVPSGGGAALVERVHRNRMVRHDYKYWENGQIREFRYDAGPDSTGVERYDSTGNQLAPR